MVVSSLLIEMRFALPSIPTVTFSSLIPRSSEITSPPVSTAMSSSMALRRSPKPGALTAATLRPPRSLLTTRVAKCLAFDVFGDDEQWTAGLNHRFEQRQHGLQARELLLVEKDVRAFQLADHLLGVGDEIGREIAAVELHAFDHFELGLEAFRLFNRDHAFLADFFHRFRDHVADGALAIGRDRADLGDFLAGRDFLGALLDVFDHDFDGHVDAALQIHRVHARGDRLGAFADDGLGQDGGRRGAVAGDVAGLARHFAQHLRAHILEFIGKFDFLGDGNAVLGNARCAEGFFEHDIAAFGAQRHFDRVGENIDARGSCGRVRRPRISHLLLPLQRAP